MPAVPPTVSRSLRRLRRRRLPYWAVALALAVVTTGVVSRLTATAAAERARWGTRRDTVVVTADVAAGGRLGPNRVAVRQLPAALVPADAVHALAPGAVTTVALHAGEAVLASRLAGRATSVVAARLPAGTRGIAVPSPDGLPLSIGDRVDVLATFDEHGGSGPPTFAVARRATVVHVGHEAVTLAVSEAAAPRVAYALVAGAVTLVLSGRS